MRITESQLRKIVRQEIMSEAADRSLNVVLRKWKHPAASEDPNMRRGFRDAASTVYHEFETRSPSGFKSDMEENMGQYEMPIEFYADLVAAMKRDEKSYWKHKEDTSYLPGYRD